MEGNDKEQQFLEQFKLKRMIKKLRAAEGNGTSLISLIIPGGKKISDYNQMLTEEIGKADNIKDRVNRQSVISALTSAKEKLKSYSNKAPKNGLCIYCGNVMLPGFKSERKLMIAIEPFKPLNSKLYKCGDKFDIEALEILLESNEKYGFVIVDGNGALFGLLQGNTKTVLSHFSVDLPKKHGRGGQSSNRFANIRLEKRLIYTKKVCEEITRIFISNDRPNVDGLVLAGYADFKNNVFENSTFDIRLRPIVLKVCDIAYGGQQGFVQAISMSQECFQNVRLVQEQKKLNKFYEQITFDTGQVCYGVNETMKLLEESAVETLIIYDNLDYQIVECRPVDPKNGTETINKYLRLSDVQYASSWTDKATGIEYKINEYDSLIDHLSEKYQDYKADLFFVTDKSEEGNQFVQGFAGIGGILKYKVDLDEYYENEYEEEDSDDDFI